MTRGPRVLVRDGTFAVTGPTGDVAGESGPLADGLFVRDARHLSRWRLTADGPLHTLLAGPDGAVLAPPGGRDEPPAYTVLRDQAVAAGVFTERVTVLNNLGRPVEAVVELLVDADFADQFELRGDHRVYPKPGAERTAAAVPGGVGFRYRRGPDWTAETRVTAVPAPDAIRPAEPPRTARVLSWRLTLPAHGSRELALTARAFAAHGPPPAEPAPPAELRAQQDRDRREFTEPPVGCAHAPDGLPRAVRHGLADLAGLRVPAVGPDGEPLRVPGAGTPWFLTLFGRDALLASLFALPYRPGLAAATLRALAAAQGTRHLDARLEAPGRIPHELRHGELAHFRQVPYGRYYGSVDATPLFLVTLQAHAAATGDPALARRLQPHARAAVEWMFRDGGLDERGYLHYTGDAGGLANQGWKDSAGAICGADGVQATGAVAVAEAQGYAYDALRRTARLAARVWDDARYAARLERAADELRDRFARDFWLPGADFPALALDGAGRRADALASNAGHLLWSGLLDRDRARRVGRRLLEPDFFSGWGIRTLAEGQSAYHPLSYHRGSVWPHDNAVIALGLARYGMAAEARTLAAALTDAARQHGWRLPEAIAGYPRALHPEPVPYPHACSPQAWAAAAPLALLTAVDGGAAP